MTSDSIGPRRGFLAVASALLVVLALQACDRQPPPTGIQPTDRPSMAAGGGSLNVDLDQCANQPTPCAWQNGDLNGNNSAYAEGEVVPFRLAIEGLTPGTHTIHINYDFTAGGHQGYDFLATYNATETVDICATGGGAVSSLCPSLGTAHQLDFPSDPFTVPDANNLSVAGAEAAALFGVATNRKLTIWGGTITAISSPVVHAGTTGGNSTGDITVTFTSTGSAVLLAWGGHLAQSNYWKEGTLPDGASEISGAPWHMRTQRLDDANANKNQDRSIQPSAVIDLTPGAKIELSPLTATNSIGDPHTVTVTVSERTDVANPYTPAAGETVTYTVVGTNGATPVVDLATSTCDDQTTNASGQCTIVFSSATAGTVTVHAQSNVSVGGETILASSGTGGDNSADAIKYYVSGSLAWVKVDGDANNAYLAGAVFTVCGPTYPNCVDVTDNVAPDANAAAGQFLLVNLDVGTYTVTEKTPPPGYNAITGQQSATLTTSAPNATITNQFVNRAPTAFITISPTTATNSTTEAHTFTAVMTVDPKGGGTPTIGAIAITVSPTPSTLGTVSCAAQAGPDASGLYTRSCTLQINSTSAGTFTANASGSATVGVVTLNRDTDPATQTIPGTGGSGPATKIYVAPTLTITKTPDNGSIVAGTTATFTIVVSNTGQGKAFNVALSDQLLSSLSWSVGSFSGWTTCAVSQTQLLSCSVAVLNAGASATVTVSASVPTSFVFVPPQANGTQLEMDGNLVSNGGTDWASQGIVSCVGTLTGCALDATGATDDSFGNGTKEDTAIPSITDGSIPPNKSDLLRFYVHNNRVTVGQAVHDFVYLAWERVLEPEGTTNMDFEFNQSTLLSSNGVTPVRTAGDLLIKYDLSNGGGTLTMGYHKWVTSGSCEANGQTAPCWGPLQSLAGAFQGRANDFGSVTDPIAPNAPRTLTTLTFGEASIDMQAAGIFTGSTCLSFGRAYLKSRSSDSFTAAIKDFVTPIPVSITNCQPRNIPNTASVSANNATGSSDTGSITVTVP